GAEFINLIAQSGLLGADRTWSAALTPLAIILSVRNPDIAVAVDIDAVREDEQAGAERRHQLSVHVEFHYRGQVGHGAGLAIQAAILTAALCYPDRLAIAVDFHRAGRAP